MSNKNFYNLMVLFSVCAGVLSFYLGIWYAMRGIYGVAFLWLVLMAELFIKTAYFIQKIKELKQ